MDVSFSVPKWKINELQNIDLKMEEEFYASTPYNLNDFKQTTKPAQPIFKIQVTNQGKYSYLKKELIDNQNVSLAIFVTFLYQFMNRVINKIQNIDQVISPVKPKNQTHQKVQKPDKGQQNEKHTERRLIQGQKQTKKEDFQILKELKLKIYEIDLCNLNDIPERLKKYMNNNLLKKIIFQYLNKVLYNLSLIQILLQSNQLLRFTITLISRSLLHKNKKIVSFNEQSVFHEEVSSFLQHFQGITQEQKSKSTDLFVINRQKQDKSSKKTKSQQYLPKNQSFTAFQITKSQMKSKYASLKQEISKHDYKYCIYLHSSQETFKQKKTQKSIKGKDVSKKTISSQKTIKIKSDAKIRPVQDTDSWIKYLGCLRYFFSDSPKK